jgi:hypothetical protein
MRRIVGFFGLEESSAYRKDREKSATRIPSSG